MRNMWTGTRTPRHKRAQSLGTALVAVCLVGCAGLPWSKDDVQVEAEAARAQYRRMLKAQRATKAESSAAIEEPGTYAQKLRDGDRYRGTGDLRRAVLAYFGAVRLDPDNVTARERMGSLELLADPARAEALFAKLIEEGAKTASVWAGLGLARLAQGRLEGAREALLQALALDPGSVRSLSALGATYDRLERHAEAQSHLQRARELRPGDASILNNLGVSYLLSGDLVQAEDAFWQASALDPHDAVSRNNLGLAVGLQGRYEDALAAFRRAGTEQSAQNNLGYVHFLNGDFEQAIARYERALLAEGKDELKVIWNLRQVQLAERNGHHQLVEEEAAVIPSAVTERIVLPDNGERPENQPADAALEPASVVLDGEFEDAPTKRTGLRYRVRNRRHPRPE